MKKILLFLVAAMLMAGHSWAKDERRPEDMLADAFDRLKSHPDEEAVVFRGENIAKWDNEFWRPNRWFSESLIKWLGRYEKCGGGAGRLGPGLTRCGTARRVDPEP